MRKNILILCGVLLSFLVACDQTVRPEPPERSQLPAASVPDQPEPVKPEDRPTVPGNVTEENAYLYDFLFSQRYDQRITEDFRVVLPNEEMPLSLFDSYEGGRNGVPEQVLDGEGMEPHIYKKYWFTAEQGEWIIVTDYYEPDNVEYISYIWTTLEGAQTNRKVGVGSTEKELLDAYQTDLYYLKKGETEVSFYAKDEEGGLSESFDYAYAWQPFTSDTNDIRDITFYMKDGEVAAIEMLEPYELRYVYGYDREAGLNCARQQRETN